MSAEAMEVTAARARLARYEAIQRADAALVSSMARLDRANSLAGVATIRVLPKRAGHKYHAFLWGNGLARHHFDRITANVHAVERRMRELQAVSS